MAIALVREYAHKSPFEQSALLATHGMELCLQIGEESEKMKKELGNVYYFGWKDDIAQAILEGKLQLPTEEEIEQILVMQ